MNTNFFGKLINKDGNNKYTNSDAPEKLIRYVTRTGGKPDNDLLAWGGLGILEYGGIELPINQFYHAQEAHTRKGDFGKYMNHEIFSFSLAGEHVILQNNLDIDEIARRMARDIFEQDHCQVIYGVHAPNNAEKHLHIHFAINAVNYRTGGKRHENMTQTLERNRRFNQLISDEIFRINA